MGIRFRNYTKQPGITEDYSLVRAFFLKLGYAEFTYARWDWMTTHSYLDKSAVGKIGVWQDGTEIVGVATYDCLLGMAFCLALPEYGYLKNAARLGFIATEQKEYDAVFYLDKTSTSYDLPDGFHITTIKDTYNLY